GSSGWFSTNHLAPVAADDQFGDPRYRQSSPKIAQATRPTTTSAAAVPPMIHGTGFSSYERATLSARIFDCLGTLNLSSMASRVSASSSRAAAARSAAVMVFRFLRTVGRGVGALDGVDIATDAVDRV